MSPAIHPRSEPPPGRERRPALGTSRSGDGRVQPEPAAADPAGTGEPSAAEPALAADPPTLTGAPFATSPPSAADPSQAPAPSWGAARSQVPDLASAVDPPAVADPTPAMDQVTRHLAQAGFRLAHLRRRLQAVDDQIIADQATNELDEAISLVRRLALAMRRTP